MRKWKHKIAMIAALLASMIGVQLVAAPAYAADYSVAGNFSWSNFPEVCTSGCNASTGNHVRLWQQILYAEYGPQISGTYPYPSCSSFVDGQFGPNTTKWTKKWQDDYLNLNGNYPYGDHPERVDGRVGPMTWGEARLNLVYNGPPSTFYTYLTSIFFDMYRTNSATWTFTKCSFHGDGD